MARIELFASRVETQHPESAGSLREGLNELVTVSAIEVAPALKRCLGTAHGIDSVHSGMRHRTGHVTMWKNGSMAVRMGGGRRPGGCEGLPNDQGLPGPLDAQGTLGRAFDSRG